MPIRRGRALLQSALPGLFLEASAAVCWLSHSTPEMQPLLPYFSCRTGRIAHHHQGIRIDFSYLLHKHTSGNNYKIKMRPNVSRRKQSICRTTFLIQQLCRSLLPCPLIPKGGTKSLIRAHLLKESSKNIGAGFENLRK